MHVTDETAGGLVAMAVHDHTSAAQKQLAHGAAFQPTVHDCCGAWGGAGTVVMVHACFGSRRSCRPGRHRAAPDDHAAHSTRTQRRHCSRLLSAAARARCWLQRRATTATACCAAANTRQMLRIVLTLAHSCAPPAPELHALTHLPVPEAPGTSAGALTSHGTVFLRAF